MPRGFGVVLVFASLLVVGCNKDAGSSGPSSGGGASLEQVQAELLSGNFGRAAELAAAYAAGNPQSSDAHLLQARAEARLGNAGDTARALERALAVGAVDLPSVLRAADFDSVRHDPAVQRLLARQQGRSVQARRSAPIQEETIRAGDVSIMTSGDSEVIRAGDLVLEAE
jgi:hypothetical protein